MNYLDNIKQEIEKSLEKVFLELGLEFQKVNFTVDVPELEHGDVTSNVCLVASKILKKAPKEVFDILLPHLTSPYKGEEKNAIAERLEFKMPGFINFYLKSEFVKSEKVKYVNLKYFGKKVLVEHTSINLFKPFTVGHLMNNFTGEFITRIMKEMGAKVTDISYPSDISIGIAKAIYIIKLDGGLEFLKKKEHIDEAVKYLGETYVRGVKEFKKFEEEKKEDEIRKVKNISNNLYGKVESEDVEIYEYAKKINLDYFYEMAKKLESNFEGFIFESEAGVRGKEIVIENVPVIFQQSEGAIIYVPGENRKDINTGVFINSEGNPTYAAKDIGLLDLKFKKYNPDFSFFITDNEQSPHFRLVLDAAKKINENWVEKSIHVPHGRMTFKGKKMSSRLGGVPSAEEVINAVYEDVCERSDERVANLNSLEKEKLQKEIALSALRIAILRSKPGVNIDFDPERASSFEGDSGPYLCYTHARCASLLERGLSLPHPASPYKGEEFSTSKIERKVLQFDFILNIAAVEIAPQKLIKYLFELASEFNSFYAQQKIIDENNLENTRYNLHLTSLAKDTLKKGLYILGINAPEKM